MLNKLRLIWLIVVGKVVGESNKPTETGYIREILVERRNAPRRLTVAEPDTARCICDKCGQPHSPKLVSGGLGRA